jgi:hypothetical protein
LNIAPSGTGATCADGVEQFALRYHAPGAHFQELNMDTNTLLIIVLILLLVGGGGWYGRGRWY